jgi:hypothetical protein
MFKRKSFLFLSLFLFIFARFSYAQEDTSKVQLVGPKLSKYLSLTEEQTAKINPSIEKIKSILKAQQERREELRSKFQSGERPSQEEMQKMRDQRQKDVDEIKALIEAVKKELTPEQLEKFKDVVLPNLEMRMGRRRDG